MLAGAAFCGWSGYLREAGVRAQHIGSGFGKEQTASAQESMR